MKPQAHSTRVRIALLSIVGVLGALAINTAVAYWATGWLFGFVPRPPEVVVQILNTIVGFLLFCDEARRTALLQLLEPYRLRFLKSNGFNPSRKFASPILMQMS